MGARVPAKLLTLDPSLPTRQRLLDVGSLMRSFAECCSKAAYGPGFSDLMVEKRVEFGIGTVFFQGLHSRIKLYR